MSKFVRTDKTLLRLAEDAVHMNNLLPIAKAVITSDLAQQLEKNNNISQFRKSAKQFVIFQYWYNVQYLSTLLSQKGNKSSSKKETL